MENGSNGSQTIKTERISNNFDFLRLFAAVLVIFSHCFPLSTGGELGEPLKALTGGAMTLGHLGVAIFFVISGYLIAKSWVRRPKVYDFFRNRILRLVPGLLCAAIFTILIIGPLSTSLPMIQYFASGGTWKYLLVPFSLGWAGNSLPAVFAGNPFPGAVNGSLWTLLPEFRMYVVIFILGAVGLLRKNTLICIVALLGAFILFNLYVTGFSGPASAALSFSGLYINNGQIEVAAILPLLFLCGSLFYVLGKKLEYNLYVALLLLILWVLSFRTDLFLISSVICLPYIIMYVAFAKIPFINKAGAYGDFSYGLYIYAFPIQQLLAYHLRALTVPEMFCLSMLLILPVSILSWTLIESKALKLKNVNLPEAFRKMALKSSDHVNIR